MQLSDLLHDKQTMFTRAREYVKQPVDKNIAGLRIRPLVSNAKVCDNRQLMLHFALPTSQEQYTDEGLHSPNYSTWGVALFPFV